MSRSSRGHETPFGLRTKGTPSAFVQSESRDLDCYGVHGKTKMKARIETSEQLQQAIEQIVNLYAALDGLRRDILPKNPRNFAVFAEGPLDEIRKLQAEISEYATRLEQVGAP